MLVSVIIPVFNVEDYLPSCLDSVLSQTHREIEVILIDDGSTDSSGKICDEYALKDSRIKVIHKANSGVADARNAGIDAASGDYIAFIDSDDYTDQDYIGYLLGLCTANSSDLACCSHRVLNSGKESNYRFRKTDPGKYTGKSDVMKAFLTTRLLSVSVWGKLFKRELFDNIRFPAGKTFYEDDSTMYRLVSESGSAVLGAEPKYVYRLHGESLIHKNTPDESLKLIDIMEDQLRLLEEHYPELVPYGKANIIMAVNHCVMKHAEYGLFHFGSKNRLKKYYREYEKFFLKGISYMPAKLFSVTAYISIPFAMRIYRLLHRVYRAEV